MPCGAVQCNSLRGPFGAGFEEKLGAGVFRVGATNHKLGEAGKRGLDEVKPAVFVLEFNKGNDFVHVGFCLDLRTQGEELGADGLGEFSAGE